MPQLIARPAEIRSSDSRPRVVQEYTGRAGGGDAAVSVAHVVNPSGWESRGQTPEFETIHVVLWGLLRVEHEGGGLEVRTGQAVIVRPGEWVRYSTPEPGGAECIKVCLPAYAPDAARYDQLERQAT